MQLQAIVDHKKWFLDIFVAMFDSMNDARVLRLFQLTKRLHWEIFSMNEICIMAINPT
jgi:hypothetical protein